MNDFNRYLKDLRIVNAFCRCSSVNQAARHLRMKPQALRNWLTDGTYRWPLYEDDRGRIYVGRLR